MMQRHVPCSIRQSPLRISYEYVCSRVLQALDDPVTLAALTVYVARWQAGSALSRQELAQIFSAELPTPPSERARQLRAALCSTELPFAVAKPKVSTCWTLVVVPLDAHLHSFSTR